MRTRLKEAELSFTNIHHSISLSSPPSLSKQPVVILDLIKLIKRNTNSLIYQKKLFNIHERYSNYSHIYTDDSKNYNRSGCGAINKNKTAKKCLLKESFIFTAETCGIKLAPNIVETSDSKRFIIHSDCF